MITVIVTALLSPILTLMLEECKKPSLKHVKNEPILLDFVNLSTIFCSRLELILVDFRGGLT